MTTLNTPSIFNYSNHSVRTVVKEDNSLWFVAKDVAEALDIAWQGTKSLVAIPAAWIGVGKLPTPQKNQSGKEYTTTQELIIINEPAVYKLAFRSNKPEAEAFTEWVASEVLPSIRKTGQYIAPVSPETLTPSEQHLLTKTVKEKAGDNHKAIPEIWGRIKNKFKVAKYSQLKSGQVQDVIDYISAMDIRTAHPVQPALLSPHSEEYYKNRIETLEERVSLHKDTASFYGSMYKDLLTIMIDLFKNRMSRS